MSNNRKTIRSRIRRNITTDTHEPDASPQAMILAGLNVLQVLTDQAPKYLQDVLSYGPGSFTGENWASVLIWHRRKGYHSYRELTLFGVWAVASGEDTELLVGTKSLEFRAVVYNPETYHQLIERGFQTYYHDEGSPPPADNVIYRTQYDPLQRLALRQELADKITHWMRQHH